MGAVRRDHDDVGGGVGDRAELLELAPVVEVLVHVLQGERSADQHAVVVDHRCGDHADVAHAEIGVHHTHAPPHPATGTDGFVHLDQHPDVGGVHVACERRQIGGRVVHLDEVGDQGVDERRAAVEVDGEDPDRCGVDRGAQSPLVVVGAGRGLGDLTQQIAHQPQHDPGGERGDGPHRHHPHRFEHVADGQCVRHQHPDDDGPRLPQPHRHREADRHDREPHEQRQPSGRVRRHERHDEQRRGHGDACRGGSHRNTTDVRRRCHDLAPDRRDEQRRHRALDDLEQGDVQADAPQQERLTVSEQPLGERRPVAEDHMARPSRHAPRPPGHSADPHPDDASKARDRPIRSARRRSVVDHQQPVSDRHRVRTARLHCRSCPPGDRRRAWSGCRRCRGCAS